MKKLNLAFALVLALGFTMKGQLIFNTGHEPSTGGVRSNLMQDVAWFVAQTPMNSITTPPGPGSYVRAVIQDPSLTGWWDPVSSATFLDATWITYPNSCIPTIPAYHGCLNDPNQAWRVDHWYKVSFYLCCQDFCIDLDMWADNRIQEVYINTMTNSGAGYWQNTRPITPFLTDGDFEGYYQSEVVSEQFCNNFRQGLNYMIIHVVSGDPYSSSDLAGLLVHERNRSGCDGITYNMLLDEDGDGDPGHKVSSIDKKADGKKALGQAKGITLAQNVPNPYDESTVINYNIPEAFNTAQLVFTAADGRIVKTVNIAEKGPGRLNVSPGDLKGGIYSYSLVVDGVTVESKKMIKQ